MSACGAAPTAASALGRVGYGQQVLGLRAEALLAGGRFCWAARLGVNPGYATSLWRLSASKQVWSAVVGWHCLTDSRQLAAVSLVCVASAHVVAT